MTPVRSIIQNEEKQPPFTFPIPNQQSSNVGSDIRMSGIPDNNPGQVPSNRDEEINSLMKTYIWENRPQTSDNSGLEPRASVQSDFVAFEKQNSQYPGGMYLYYQGALESLPNFDGDAAAPLKKSSFISDTPIPPPPFEGSIYQPDQSNNGAKPDNLIYAKNFN